LPTRYGKVDDIVREVDVVWLQRGSSELRAMFEVEYSTPIYSGLLRFNDLHLVEPNLQLKFSIISNDLRRALFLRQINRPTFKMSGLSEICNFMEYKDVFNWFNRTKGA
jgi:type II restriction enzyme